MPTNSWIDETEEDDSSNSTNVVLRKLRKAFAQNLVQAVTHAP